MQSRSNSPTDSFNMVRLSAAWTVLWSHSYTLTGDANEPIFRAIGISGGHVAVDIFFFTSGLLISGSIERGTALPVFIRNRALRILPGLWVMLFATSIAYIMITFLHHETVNWRSVLQFLIRNGALFSSNMQYEIGTAFVGNPYPGVVNGSLWTLPWEVRMYLLLGLAGYLLRPVRTHAYIALALLGWGLWHFGSMIATSGVISYSDPWRFMFFFFLGATTRRTWRYRSGFWTDGPLPKWWAVAAVGLISFVAQVLPSWTLIAYSAALPIAVLSVGYGWVSTGYMANFMGKQDISYGTYLYAFPIQQSIVSMTSDISPAALTVASTIPTLVVAWLSWRMVESRALAYKGNVAAGSKAPLKTEAN